MEKNILCSIWNYALNPLKLSGILIRKVGNLLIPYNIAKLAEITRTDVDTAAVAMDLLQKIGLVEILENRRNLLHTGI